MVQGSQAERRFPTMMWNGDGHWGSGDWATLALIVIAVIAVIVAIVFLVRYLSRTGSTSSASATAVPPAAASGPESPKDILKRRYAAGEIDRDEYLRMLGDP
jgi:putative membrane protein